MCIISLEETPFNIQSLKFSSKFIKKGLRYDEGGNIPLSCLTDKYKNELLNTPIKISNICLDLKNQSDRILSNIIQNSSPFYNETKEGILIY